nr:hypothetical protein [uncultured Halomonas sp.]
MHGKVVVAIEFTDAVAFDREMAVAADRLGAVVFGEAEACPGSSSGRSLAALIGYPV